MEAILQAITSGKIKNVTPRVVISSKPNVPGLEKAQKMGIPIQVIHNSDSGWQYDKNIVTILQDHLVEPQKGLVCLAGYMRILSPEFINMFRMRILNIHPSLLPSFPGLRAQKQALEYGVKVSGCTVHFVDEGTDTGPIIAQSTICVEDEDTEETLSNKILNNEHGLYVKCVKLFADGRLSLQGRRVVCCLES
jgi:phosphoribosylglycinamide formyltransferase 1